MVHVAKERGDKFTVNAYNPGWIPATGLIKEYGAAIQFFAYYILPWLVMWRKGVSTVERSGKFLAQMAADEEFEGVSGKYFDIDVETKSSVDSYQESRQRQLYEYSLELLHTLNK